MSDALQPTTNFIPPPEVFAPGEGRCATCGNVRRLDGSFCHRCKQAKATARLLTANESAHQRRMTEQVAALIRQLNSDHPDVPSLSLITAKMLTALGGVDGLVTQCVAAIEQCKGKTKVDAYFGLMKMAAKAGEQNAAMQGLLSATSDELHNFILQIAAEQAEAEEPSQMLEDVLRKQYARKGLKLLVIDEETIVEGNALPEPVTPHPADQAGVA